MQLSTSQLVSGPWPDLLQHSLCPRTWCTPSVLHAFIDITNGITLCVESAAGSQLRSLYRPHRDDKVILNPLILHMESRYTAYLHLDPVTRIILSPWWTTDASALEHVFIHPTLLPDLWF